MSFLAPITVAQLKQKFQEEYGLKTKQIILKSGGNILPNDLVITTNCDIELALNLKRVRFSESPLKKMS